MKVTKAGLKQIIKEEIEKTVKEGFLDFFKKDKGDDCTDYVETATQLKILMNKGYLSPEEDARHEELSAKVMDYFNNKLDVVKRCDQALIAKSKELGLI